MRSSNASSSAHHAAGLASIDTPNPLIVKVIPVERIGAAFIPSACKNFIEEYVALAGYKAASSGRIRKPRGSVQRPSLEDDTYVPMPLGV